MCEWQIEIVIFATRQNVQFTVRADTLTRAKTLALRQFRAIDPSRKNLYLEARGHKTYTIVSDIYDIGSMCLEQVAEAIR